MFFFALDFVLFGLFILLCFYFASVCFRLLCSSLCLTLRCVCLFCSSLLLLCILFCWFRSYLLLALRLLRLFVLLSVLLCFCFRLCFDLLLTLFCFCLSCSSSRLRCLFWCWSAPVLRCFDFAVVFVFVCFVLLCADCVLLAFLLRCCYAALFVLFVFARRCCWLCFCFVCLCSSLPRRCLFCFCVCSSLLLTLFWFCLCLLAFVLRCLFVFACVLLCLWLRLWFGVFCSSLLLLRLFVFVWRCSSSLSWLCSLLFAFVLLCCCSAFLFRSFCSSVCWTVFRSVSSPSCLRRLFVFCLCYSSLLLMLLRVCLLLFLFDFTWHFALFVFFFFAFDSAFVLGSCSSSLFYCACLCLSACVLLCLWLRSVFVCVCSSLCVRCLFCVGVLLPLCFCVCRCRYSCFCFCFLPVSVLLCFGFVYGGFFFCVACAALFVFVWCCSSLSLALPLFLLGVFFSGVALPFLCLWLRPLCFDFVLALVAFVLLCRCDAFLFWFGVFFFGCLLLCLCCSSLPRAAFVCFCLCVFFSAVDLALIMYAAALRWFYLVLCLRACVLLWLRVTFVCLALLCLFYLAALLCLFCESLWLTLFCFVWFLVFAFTSPCLPFLLGVFLFAFDVASCLSAHVLLCFTLHCALAVVFFFALDVGFVLCVFIIRCFTACVASVCVCSSVRLTLFAFVCFWSSLLLHLLFPFRRALALRCVCFRSRSLLLFLCVVLLRCFGIALWVFFFFFGFTLFIVLSAGALLRRWPCGCFVCVRSSLSWRSSCSFLLSVCALPCPPFDFALAADAPLCLTWLFCSCLCHAFLLTLFLFVLLFFGFTPPFLLLVLLCFGCVLFFHVRCSSVYFTSHVVLSACVPLCFEFVSCCVLASPLLHLAALVLYVLLFFAMWLCVSRLFAVAPRCFYFACCFASCSFSVAFWLCFCFCWRPFFFACVLSVFCLRVSFFTFDFASRSPVVLPLCFTLPVWLWFAFGSPCALTLLLVLSAVALFCADFVSVWFPTSLCLLYRFVVVCVLLCRCLCFCFAVVSVCVDTLCFDCAFFVLLVLFFVFDFW